MLKQDFLEKPYNYMNNILFFLYNNQGKSTKSQLVATFDISLPTLNEYLSFTQDFLKENNLNEQVVLLLEGENIYLKKAATFPFKKILLLFLKKSIKFQMVLQLFHKNAISCEQFQLSYAISAATYYRKIIELNAVLQEFHLQIKRGKLVGAEKQIHYFFFSFFWFLFEDKEELEKEMRNQYIEFIQILEKYLHIGFDPIEILQIKLWMKISFKRSMVEPNQLINQQYKTLDRPLLNDIQNIFRYYMKKTERSYKKHDICMFYDFFCAMNNFSLNSAFSLRLAEAQKKENSTLYMMNQIILTYLKKYGYFPSVVLRNHLLYVENLLFQLHARIYYFDGFILPFENWTLESESMVDGLADPFAENEVFELLQITNKKYKKHHNYKNKFTEMHYTIILNYVTQLNEKKFKIGVYHSLNPWISQLIIQNLENILNCKYPIKIELFSEEINYDLVLSNVQMKTFLTKQDTVYIYSDIVSTYDVIEIKKIITKLFAQTSMGH